MIEITLGGIILLSVILRDVFGYTHFENAIMIAGSLLGIIYLFTNW